MARVARRKDSNGHDRVDGIQRGMIFWASVTPAESKGSEQTHDQPSPWVIISADHLHQRLPIVQAVPLTSQLHQEEKYRRARIRIPDAMIDRYPDASPPLQPGDSLALTEQLRAMSHSRLKGEPIGQLKKQAILSIEAGIRDCLGV